MTWQEQILTGTDLNLLVQEMKKAQDILEKVKEMKSGVIGNTRISMQSSIDTAVSSVSFQLIYLFCPYYTITTTHHAVIFTPPGIQLRGQSSQRHYIRLCVNGKGFGRHSADLILIYENWVQT